MWFCTEYSKRWIEAQFTTYVFLDFCNEEKITGALDHLESFLGNICAIVLFSLGIGRLSSFIASVVLEFRAAVMSVSAWPKIYLGNFRHFSRVQIVDFHLHFHSTFRFRGDAAMELPVGLTARPSLQPRGINLLHSPSSLHLLLIPRCRSLQHARELTHICFSPSSELALLIVFM